MLFYVRDRGPVKKPADAIQKQNAGANTSGSKNNHQLTASLGGANTLFRPMEIKNVNSNPNAPSSHIPVFQNGNLPPVQKPSQSNSNSDPATSKDTASKDPIQVPPVTEPSVVTATGNSSGKVSKVLDERPQKSGNVGMHVDVIRKVIEEGCNTSNGLDALAKHEPRGDAGSAIALSKPESLGIVSNGDTTSAKPKLLGTVSNGVDASAKPEFKEITSDVPMINQENLVRVSTVPKVTLVCFYFYFYFVIKLSNLCSMLDSFYPLSVMLLVANKNLVKRK